VRNLYGLAPRRDPEANALERDVAKLTEGTLSPATLPRAFRSPSIPTIRLLPGVSPSSANGLHK